MLDFPERLTPAEREQAAAERQAVREAAAAEVRAAHLREFEREREPERRRLAQRIAERQEDQREFQARQAELERARYEQALAPERQAAWRTYRLAHPSASAESFEAVWKAVRPSLAEWRETFIQSEMLALEQRNARDGLALL